MRASDVIPFVLFLGLFAAVVLWLTRGSRAIAAAQNQGTGSAWTIPIFDANPAFQIPLKPLTFNPNDFLLTQDIGGGGS